MTKERAIEILERKTTIPNDGETFEEISDAIDMAISALKKSNPKGEWIKTGLSPYIKYKCSVCGRTEPTDNEPFCHCGADMRGE